MTFLWNEDLQRDAVSPEVPAQLPSREKGKVPERAIDDQHTAERLTTDIMKDADRAVESLVSQEIPPEAVADLVTTLTSIDERAAQAHAEYQKKVLESKRAGYERQTREFRDAEGRVICRLEMHCSRETRSLPGEGGKMRPTRQVYDIILHGEKDGKPTQIDLLKLTNPTGVAVYMNLHHNRDYYHVAKDHLISIPPLDSPIGIGIMLHELGHAEQKTVPGMQALSKYYHFTNEFGVPSLEVVTKMVAAIPEIRTILGDDVAVFDKIETLTKKITTIEATCEPLRPEVEKYIEEYTAEKGPTITDSAIDAAVVEKFPQFADAQSTQKELSEAAAAAFSVTIKHLSVMKVPQRVIELDATLQALRWMQQIKEESGINLQAAVRVDAAHVKAGKPSRQKKDTGSGCADAPGDMKSATTVETSIMRELIGSFRRAYGGMEHVPRRLLGRNDKTR